MNKTELIAQVAEKTGTTRKDAEQVISTMLEVIPHLLKPVATNTREESAPSASSSPSSANFAACNAPAIFSLFR